MIPGFVFNSYKEKSLRHPSKTYHHWATRIRTWKCWSQNPVPYHLAIAQYLNFAPISIGATCVRRFELPTPWSVAKCSIQLSYTHILFTSQAFICNCKFPLTTELIIHHKYLFVNNFSKFF